MDSVKKINTFRERESTMNDLENIQGVKVNYYYICKRKLWLFSKDITLEDTNDRVIQGKILHEYSYERDKQKEILIDGIIKLDRVEKDYIREIKISSSMEKADEMQLYYYLYYLKQKGILKKGKVNYTEEKRVEVLELTPQIEQELQQTIREIKVIEALSSPPKLQKYKYCKKCAYYNFCYVEEF